MKLVTLNIWGGKISEPLIEFLKEKSDEIDIFCLQEVFNNPPGVPSVIQKEAKLNIFLDIEKAVPDHKGYMAPTQENEESLAMFVRKDIEVGRIDERYVYRWKNSMVNNDPSTYGIIVQYVQFQNSNKRFTIGNLHGHWTPNYKGDNPERLEQAKNIRDFLDSMEGVKILCGDFNMNPDTKSMEIIEKGIRNLVKEYGVTSTRSHFYKKEGKFADYILVSPEVEVKDFKVLQNPVSDHLPLLLEFN